MLGNGSFTYIPTAGFSGTDSFQVVVWDGEATVVRTVNIEVARGNVSPIVNAPIEDQSTPEDAEFTFVMPANVFTDADGDTLTLTATLADGSPLPEWLTFTPATRTFSGTPPQDFNGVVSVKVTASDGEFSASDSFDITVDARERCADA